MLPFDARRVCPKCLGADVGASHHKDEWDTGCSYYCPGKQEGEHIVRHCRQCHYEWAEAPRDREEEKE